MRFARRGSRRWLDVRFFDPDDQDVSLTARWFQAFPSMEAKFPEGEKVRLFGTIKSRAGKLEMANPEVLGENDGKILVRYRAVPKVPAKTLRKAIGAALEHAKAMPDPIPKEFCKERDMPTLAASLQVLHNPELAEESELGAICGFASRYHRRLAFGELFALSTVVRLQRRYAQKEEAPAFLPKETSKKALAAVSDILPFTLTSAQRRAIETIYGDIGKEVPMSRLLQGDVGSGKTAVIFAAALKVVRGGGQAAIMAPTEILAEQHFRTLSDWFEQAGFRVGYSSGSQKNAVKNSTRSLVAAGQVHVLVGTHALLSDYISFANLGLVVIDEQHRFGVEQRSRLRGKRNQEGLPHLLVTTATPIPRSLALTAFGDLETSVLDEMPAGRSPIDTVVAYGDEGRKSAFDLLKETLSREEQAYLVCPLVEPGEETPMGADAEGVFARLQKSMPEANPVLVHGRLSSEERLSAFADFRSGKAKVMVATTVIEVGVDVANATLMIIRDADRFGLAQLHQLRGRVGRSDKKSKCVLLCRGNETSDGAERLKVMGETTDGFVIADKDLEIRGPGDFLGASQSGMPRLRFGNIALQTELLLEARDAAMGVLEADPMLKKHPELLAIVEHLERRGDAMGTDGG